MCQNAGFLFLGSDGITDPFDLCKVFQASQNTKETPVDSSKQTLAESVTNYFIMDQLFQESPLSPADMLMKVTNDQVQYYQTPNQYLYKIKT